MINFLFLLANAYASNVYDICKSKRQIWSERDQTFKTQSSRTYYSGETVRLIFHSKYFEVNRDYRDIQKVRKKGSKTCWVEHSNSEICYDSKNKVFYWEFHKRNGDVLRDVLDVCIINGRVVR